MPKPLTQKLFSQALLQATRLTRLGKLMDATRLIQRALLGTAPTAKTRPQTQPRAQPPPQTQKTLHSAPPPTAFDGTPDRAPGRTPTQIPTFTKHQFVFDGEAYPYRLYLPSASVDDTQTAASMQGMPLVVLLHGCKQDTLDFSHGTAMNDLAGKHQAMVLYPEQITSGNAMRCWNWFDPSHQQAGRGEPGMIAALVQKMITQHSADPDRIYVAGLSAGGAMAAVVANLYPQLFAAVGVHSGLAAGAAQSVMQAFSAMQDGAKGSHTTALPTIVFHGTADQTVNPSNAKYITEAALAAFKAEGLTLVKTKVRVQDTGGRDAAGETVDRTLYSNASGKPFVETWRINQGPHAWSGGSARGSYTDPEGPDASRAMLAFFLQHHRGSRTH